MFSESVNNCVSLIHIPYWHGIVLGGWQGVVPCRIDAVPVIRELECANTIIDELLDDQAVTIERRMHVNQNRNSLARCTYLARIVRERCCYLNVAMTEKHSAVGSVLTGPMASVD